LGGPPRAAVNPMPATTYTVTHASPDPRAPSVRVRARSALAATLIGSRQLGVPADRLFAAARGA
jgi:hypothetical protein